MNVSVTLDIAYDESLDGALIEMCLDAGEGVSAEVVNERGPAGGWPEVRFSGPEDAVRRLIVAYTEGDADTTQMYVEALER